MTYKCTKIYTATLYPFKATAIVTGLQMLQVGRVQRVYFYDCRWGSLVVFQVTKDYV